MEPKKVELIAQITTKGGASLVVSMAEDSIEAAYSEAADCIREGGIFMWPAQEERPFLIVAGSEVSIFALFTKEQFDKAASEHRRMVAAQQAGILVPGNGAPAPYGRG